MESNLPQQSQTSSEENVIVLVCGIIGLVIAPVGIVALVLGLRARRLAAASGKPIDSMMAVGYILGIISTVLLLVGIAFFIMALLIFGVIVLVS